MSLITLGSGSFTDLYTPAKGKNEWGMDTLRRKVSGARSLLEAYLLSLAQGQVYQDYFLQSWEPDDSPDVASVTLLYKGLATGGTPTPDIQTEIAPATGSISKSYAGENGGRGRVYQVKPILKIELGVFVGLGEENTILFDKDIYATGVTMEFTYDAVQTVYRYIKTGKPVAPTYFAVDIPRIPVIKRARYTTSDGTIYGINAPSAITIDLTPDILNRVVSFSANHVIGTPFYECQDVVRRELGEGDADTEGSFGG